MSGYNVSARANQDIAATPRDVPIRLDLNSMAAQFGCDVGKNMGVRWNYYSGALYRL
jgi:hypothetical protein